jgi:hypothetical protein
MDMMASSGIDTRTMIREYLAENLKLKSTVWHMRKQVEISLELDGIEITKTMIDLPLF